jgi:hypothetical protein
LPGWAGALLRGLMRSLPRAVLYGGLAATTLAYAGSALVYLDYREAHVGAAAHPPTPASTGQTATARTAPVQPSVQSSQAAVPGPASPAPSAPPQIIRLAGLRVDPIVWTLNHLGITAAILLKWAAILLAAALAGWLAQSRYLHTVRLRRDFDPQPGDPLANDARKFLESLRFQQSYTAGWSGSLKLPVGLESGVNSAHTLARLQRSLPELVGDFRDFLGRVAAKYGRVCLCIDELDKMESDDKAHLFLNEIKAIFGVKDVFYLVSVSENAISAFERRGLPFRDVFDSSFDAIVHVDYMKLSEAKDLLKRRTTRVPEPFLCLCQCLAGGLPRDLIRACRQMLNLAAEARQDGRQLELIPLARRAVGAEVKGKARGMSIAASKLTADADQTNFLSALTELLTHRMDETELLERAEALVASADEKRVRMGKFSMTDDAPIREQVLQLSALANLETEFGLYLAYVATVLEVMIDLRPLWPQADAEAGTVEDAIHPWKAIPKIELYCDRLAATRQALAVSVQVGREHLVKFRLELALPVGAIKAGAVQNAPPDPGAANPQLSTAETTPQPA